jgi:hypothetical protein
VAKPTEASAIPPAITSRRVVVTLSSLELKQRQVAWRYYDWFRPSIAGIVLSAPSTVKIFSLCSPECQAAGNVPRRTAALGHDNNPADQFVSDSSKYMRSAPMAWISIALNHLPRRRRACPGDDGSGADICMA